MNELDQINIAKASKGDSKAFKLLYDHYSPFIWRVIYRTTGGLSDSSECIMQNVFVSVHSKLKGFRFESALSTWLYRIAYNESILFLKKKNLSAKRTVTVDDIDMIDKRELNHDDRRFVDKILLDLNPDERFILLSKEVDGLSFEDISVITGKNSGALRTALHRIKSEIRRRFDRE